MMSGVLPSVVKQPALIPPCVTRHLARTADPSLSPGRHQQLDMAEQRVSDSAAVPGSSAAGQKTLTDVEHVSLAGQIVLPTLVSGETACVQEADNQPDDLSTKHECVKDRSSTETTTEKIFAAEESRQHTPPAGDSSTEENIKPTIVGDNLLTDTETVSMATRNKQTPDVCERLSMETEIEQTLAPDILPTTPDNLSAEAMKPESLLCNPSLAELTLKPERTDSRDGSVNAVDTVDTVSSTGELTYAN